MRCLLKPAAVLAAGLALGPGAARGEQPRDEPVTMTAPPRVEAQLRSRRPRPAPPGTRRPVKTETILLDEDFEGSWPLPPWSVFSGNDDLEVTWGRSQFRAADGSFSLWCAGGGDDAPADGEPVPPRTAAWAVAGPFDLTEATTGTLTFDLWLQTEPIYDNVMWLASLDGLQFTGRARSEDTNGWRSMSVSLEAWPGGAVDLTGQPSVWIAFVYVSDGDHPFPGAFVDRVRLVADSGEIGASGRTFDTADDFEEGTRVGTVVESDAFALAPAWNAYPSLWVPAFEDGTVSRLDVETAAEVARYRTGPSDAETRPAGTAVDLDGACWVGNQGTGSVVKIGLPDRGDCIDRNGNGTIETSSDLDEDGDIGADELLDWGEDECVLFEVVLTPDAEGVHPPGEDHDQYSELAIQSVAVGGDNTLWVSAAEIRTVFQVDGTSGAVLDEHSLGPVSTRPFDVIVDGRGRVWCSAWPDPRVIRIDPDTAELTPVELVHGSRRLTLDGNDHLWISGFLNSAVSRIDLNTDERDLSFLSDYDSRGLAATENERILVAGSTSRTVKQYNFDGFQTRQTTTQTSPTTIALDGFGVAWALGGWGGVVVQMDPDSLAFGVQKRIADVNRLLPTGDLTGLVARSLTAGYGSWLAVHDSQQPQTAWGAVTWSATVPEESRLRIRVRTSDDGAIWSGWEIAENDNPLISTPAGRYIQVEAGMWRSPEGESPLVDRLSVLTLAEITAPEAQFSWAPASPLVGQRVTFSDESIGDPTSWSWDFGDGSSSSETDPSHIYQEPGLYTVGLTVGNDVGDDTITQDVLVDTRGPADVPAPLPG